MNVDRHRRFFVPFEKVDKAKRTVWGVAQSEAVDTQDDLLTFEASLDAFTNWSGNIREQHDDSKAVGRAVQIVADQTARKIVVGARISLGAEDTWQKVLDGTLTGYSIGGIIFDATIVFDPALKRDIRKVSRYELFELSLVDVPANSQCVITAVQKRGHNLVATGVLQTHSLGALSLSELLDKHSKGNHMATKRAKVQPVVAFNKSLTPKEEIILVRLSDVTRTANGTIVLTKNAQVSAPIVKEDLDADGYDNDANEGGDDDSSPAKIDFEGHAEDAAKMHKAMCKMAGIDDNEAHYAEVTRDDDADPDDGQGGMEAADMDPKSRRPKKGQRRTLKSATPSALEAKVDGLASAIAEMTKASKSQEPAPRIGTEGSPVAKGGANGATTEEQSLRTELKELEAKREAFIVKSGSKPSESERRERTAVLERISFVRTKLGG